MPPDDFPLPLWMKLLIGAVACGGAVVWERMARRKRRGLPIVPYEPRRPVPWNANDLVLTILFVVVLGFIANVTITHFYGAQETTQATQAAMGASSVVELLGVLIGITLLRFQAYATWADLGLSTSHLGRDIALGAAALLACIAPIWILQALLKHWVDYKQPLIEAVQAKPDAATFLVTTVAAVVAAPIFEEFLFRVLLQGWLEAIEARRRVIRLGLPGDGPSWWPIVLSSLLFAMMHVGQGAAPIPLFLLALVMGYLYQRTHRIWPSMTAHLLLNACSMAMLWWQVHHAGT